MSPHDQRKYWQNSEALQNSQAGQSYPFPGPTPQSGYMYSSSAYSNNANQPVKSQVIYPHAHTYSASSTWPARPNPAQSALPSYANTPPVATWAAPGASATAPGIAFQQPFPNPMSITPSRTEFVNQPTAIAMSGTWDKGLFAKRFRLPSGDEVTPLPNQTLALPGTPEWDQYKSTSFYNASDGAQWCVPSESATTPTIHVYPPSPTYHGTARTLGIFRRAAALVGKARSSTNNSHGKSTKRGKSTKPSPGQRTIQPGFLRGEIDHRKKTDDPAGAASSLCDRCASGNLGCHPYYTGYWPLRSQSERATHPPGHDFEPCPPCAEDGIPCKSRFINVWRRREGGDDYLECVLNTWDWEKEDGDGDSEDQHSGDDNIEDADRRTDSEEDADWEWE